MKSALGDIHHKLGHVTIVISTVSTNKNSLIGSTSYKTEEQDEIISSKA